MNRSEKINFNFLEHYGIEENSFIVKNKNVSSSFIMIELGKIIDILEEYFIKFEVDKDYNIHIF